MPVPFSAIELAMAIGECEYPAGCDQGAGYRVRVQGRELDLCLAHTSDVKGAVEADEALRGGPAASDAQKRAVQRDPGAREGRDRIFDALGLAHD
jgi:hypothetical protein